MIGYRLSMLWPGGLRKALTFSYDDNVLQDIRLIDLMRKNGLKGTFNLNSGSLGGKDHIMGDGRKVDHSHVAAEDVCGVYQGFEVAVHTKTHPNLCELPDAQVLDEVIGDRRNLEALVHYPVRGMAYPYGSLNERVIGLLEKCGIAYARGVTCTKKFNLPVNRMNWSCCCHHLDLYSMTGPFLCDSGSDAKLLAVWGHAYEFDQRGDWAQMEDQMYRLGGHADIWYASNIEIFDYLHAFHELQRSVDGHVVMNHSSIDVYCSANQDHTLCIPSGKKVVLK